MFSRPGGYDRLPMYAFSDSVSRRRSSPSSRSSPSYLTRPRSSWTPSSNNPKAKSFLYIRPRHFLILVKFVVPTAVIFLLIGLFLYEPHIELAFYSRDWLRKEIASVPPLLGCFNPERVSPLYNVSDALYGPRHTEVQAGMPMRLGLDCYDFAGTVQIRGQSGQQGTRSNFHTYWRVDLAPFEERQEQMLRSFFATQPLNSSRLILWSNGDLSGNPILSRYRRHYPDSFDLRVVNLSELARGTPLDGSDLLHRKDVRAWVDGDLVRLMVIWAHGGVWVDMDSLLTRSLQPLLEHEFVTQWDCYDKLYQPFNGALMHFRQHSPYLCEAFHIMATSAPPRSGSTDWGALLYLKLWRRLIAASVPPFKVLPFCFSDGRSCRLDNRLPDPFVPDGRGRGAWTQPRELVEGGGLDDTLKKVFAIHLHNQWDKVFPKGGWVERLLLRRYEQELSLRES